MKAKKPRNTDSPHKCLVNHRGGEQNGRRPARDIAAAYHYLSAAKVTDREILLAMESLTETEVKTIGECLRAASEGPFFADEGAQDRYWEFHALFGLSHDEFTVLATAWPNAGEDRESMNLAVNNAMNNLLGYPHGHEREWAQWISVPREEVTRIFAKWRRLEGQDLENGRFIDRLM